VSLRIQFTISEKEAQTVFTDIHQIAPPSRAIVAITNAPGRIDSKLLIVLTDDPEVEFLLKIKYAGCESYTMRF